MEEINERGEKLCFFFSDFVLEEPSVTDNEKMEVYKIIQEMVRKGIQVIACVSPLAFSDLFSHYTEHVLSKIKEVGGKILEIKNPSKFLVELEILLKEN